MNRDALARQTRFDEPERDSPQTQAPADWQTDDDKAARSKKNILLWRSYLPEDCVATMIIMGWDLST
jgi:hypothetical protein